MSKTRRVLGMMLALAVLKAPVDGLLTAMLPDASVAPLAVGLAGMAVSLLLLGIPAWMLHPWRSIRLPRQNTVWPGLLLAVLAALLARMAAAPADGAWQSWLGLVQRPLPVPGSPATAVGYVLMLAVVPAVTEEAFFRGAVLTGLLDGSRRATAVLLTALAFTLMHGSAENLPGLLMLSLMLTLLMLHTGRIAVPVTAHLVYNLTALAGVSIPLWVSILGGAGLIGLGAYIILRQPKMAHPPMHWLDGLLAAGACAVLAALYFI